MTGLSYWKLSAAMARHLDDDGGNAVFAALAWAYEGEANKWA